MANAALIETLRAADAIQFGESKLSHGGTSSYCMDKYLFEADPRCLKLIAGAFAEHVVDDDKLAGVVLGMVSLVAATTVETDKPYVITREKAKEYKVAKRIEDTLDRSKEVVVPKGTATTSQNAVDAVGALRKVGAVVDRVAVIVDRQEDVAELLADYDIALESLLTAGDLLADTDG